MRISGAASRAVSWATRMRKRLRRNSAARHWVREPPRLRRGGFSMGSTESAAHRGKISAKPVRDLICCSGRAKAGYGIVIHSLSETATNMAGVLHIPHFRFGLKTMNNIKIKVLLPALFALAVLLAVLQGGLGMRSVLELETQADTIGGRMEQSMMIANMDRLFLDVRRLYLLALSAGSAADKKASLEQLDAAGKTRIEVFQAFGATAMHPVAREKFDALEKIVAEYDVLGAEFVQLVSSSRVYEA